MPGSTQSARAIATLAQLLAQHQRILVLDAASTRTQVGLLRAGADALWQQQADGKFVEVGAAVGAQIARAHGGELALVGGQTSEVGFRLTVPLSAVSTDPADGSYVEVVDQTEQQTSSHRVNVTLGLSNGSQIEVTGDLKDGDRVILTIAPRKKTSFFGS